jgi:2-oxoglutarate ferredoxin oxidoreductase subunit gamma
MPEVLTQTVDLPDRTPVDTTSRIVVGGAGGHGVLVFGRLLAVAGMERYGRATFVPVYDPEIHGSPVNSFVIVSSSDITAPVSSQYDFGVLFDTRAANEHHAKVPATGTVLVNSSAVGDTFEAAARVVRVPATAEALRLGNAKFTNMYMLGAFLAVSGLFDETEITRSLETILPKHRHALIADNMAAISAGRQFAAAL